MFVTLGSYGAAALAFLSPRVYHGFDSPMIISFQLALVWLALLIFGIGRYKRKGVWMLLGAPLALFWPVLMVLLIFHGGPT